MTSNNTAHILYKPPTPAAAMLQAMIAAVIQNCAIIRGTCGRRAAGGDSSCDWGRRAACSARWRPLGRERPRVRPSPSRRTGSSWPCSCIDRNLLNHQSVALPLLAQHHYPALQLLHHRLQPMHALQLQLAALERLLELVEVAVVALRQQRATFISL